MYTVWALSHALSGWVWCGAWRWWLCGGHNSNTDSTCSVKHLNSPHGNTNRDIVCFQQKRKQKQLLVDFDAHAESGKFLTFFVKVLFMQRNSSFSQNFVRKEPWPYGLSRLSATPRKQLKSPWLKAQKQAYWSWHAQVDPRARACSFPACATKTFVERR